MSPSLSDLQAGTSIFHGVDEFLKSKLGLHDDAAITSFAEPYNQPRVQLYLIVVIWVALLCFPLIVFMFLQILCEST